MSLGAGRVAPLSAFVTHEPLEIGWEPPPFLEHIIANTAPYCTINIPRLTHLHLVPAFWGGFDSPSRACRPIGLVAQGTLCRANVDVADPSKLPCLFGWA